MTGQGAAGLITAGRFDELGVFGHNLAQIDTIFDLLFNFP
jgi:hypothetical protein